MWVFCKHGFFSAVEHRQKRDCVLLRARFEGDLERLQQAYGFDFKVEHTPLADYPYRTTISKDVWARIVGEIAIEIDYDNFKNSVHDGTSRDAAYMECWYALRKAQD